MSDVTALLQVARHELGTAESPPGSNRTKYGDWYGMSAAWCGMFVSWCAANSGNSDVIPRFSYTPAGAAWFQGRASWGHEPRVGAIVFYDVSNVGRISHTGIVESVRADGSWDAIEGNTDSAGSRTGGSVRRQRRSTVGTSRGGFGYPAYGVYLPSEPATSGRPTIRQGSAGDAVRAAQSALNAYLTDQQLPPLTVDGQFGPRTTAAVVLYQRAHGLNPDGIVGPATWGLLGP